MEGVALSYFPLRELKPERQQKNSENDCKANSI